MSLKSSIVVVNEFSIKNRRGGSRGGTPGKYVLRYMSRGDAVEDLSPVRKNESDTYATRFVMRRDATKSADSFKNIHAKIKNAQGLGGVGFSQNDVSLSDKKLHQLSNDIQNEFDNGKTVFKTVVSFTEEYLKANNVIDKDFVYREKGDYKGNVDQMKLRLAIMDGMKRLSRDFDDLEWVGVIQVDTKHVHCHLCMVDKGEGHLMPDNTQKGKLTEAHKQSLRRGIDLGLKHMQATRMLTSNASYDRRNLRCYIKSYTHKTMSDRGLTQLLIACLPEDKSVWRAESTNPSMKKANAILEEYVADLFDKPDSGYAQAIASIVRDGENKQQRENLTDKARDAYIKSQRDKLVNGCMNSVYDVLRNIPSYEKRIRTPMLDAMSMDYEALAAKRDDPLTEFGFKFRSYSSRLDYHKKCRDQSHAQVKSYEAARDANAVSEQSRVIYDFFRLEEEYQDCLMSKYQHFLLFRSRKDEYEDEIKQIRAKRLKYEHMQAFHDDPEVLRFSPDTAEKYGRQVYSMNGGRYFVLAPAVFERRLAQVKAEYETALDDFNFELAKRGLVFKDDKVVPREAHKFDDVKALDLHHLTYDFKNEFKLADRYADAFIDMADRRYAAYKAAETFLVQTGQANAVQLLPSDDVHAMKLYADSLRREPVLQPSLPHGSDFTRSGTISLDEDYDAFMQRAVQETLRNSQSEIA